MDAETILRIKPALTRYLHEFDGCFGRCTTRRHLDTYVQGQLSALERKSVEPIADAAGTPPRTLQEFLGLFKWDESAVRDRLQQRVARRHAHLHAVGLLDETSFPKKGAKTAAVQRQYCGAVGKTENCVVSVHLGYATPDFHTLLDGEVYLPEKTWHQDRERSRAAGIPDDVVYRSKWQIGLEQIRRALSNGVRFAYLTFDEGYGGKPPFLRALDALGQTYVAEFRQEHRGEKPGPLGGPGSHGDGLPRADLAPGRTVLADAGRDDPPPVAYDPATQRAGRPQPPQANPAASARPRRVFEEPTHVSVAQLVAL